MKMIAQAVKVTKLTDEVVAIGDSLQPGRTIRTICPRCGGGSSKESSFTISRTSGNRLFYCCFRASCHWKGTLVDGEFTNTNIRLPFERRTRRFTYPVSELSPEQVLWFREKFGLGPDPDTLYCDDKDMYAYKIRGPEFQHRGWQLRSYYKGAPVKADNYVERDEPFISWYYPEDKEIGGVVVVEDIPSARKVSLCGVIGVSLLGTSMDFERAYEIAAHSEGFVVLALDRGQLAQCIKYRDKYESIWGSTEIWQLDKDLKEVSRLRIRQALYDGKPDFISDIDEQE